MLLQLLAPTNARFSALMPSPKNEAETPTASAFTLPADTFTPNPALRSGKKAVDFKTLEELLDYIEEKSPVLATYIRDPQDFSLSLNRNQLKTLAQHSLKAIERIEENNGIMSDDILTDFLRLKTTLTRGSKPGLRNKYRN